MEDVVVINEFLPVSPIPKEVLESQPSRTDDPSSLVSVEVRPMKSDEADEAGAPHKTKHGNVIYIYILYVYIYMIYVYIYDICIYIYDICIILYHVNQNQIHHIHLSHLVFHP